MNPEVIKEVVSNTKNDLILFFVLTTCAVVALALPLYKASSKANKERLELSFKREQLMLRVVSDNSSVISKLTTLIESNNKSCNECKLEQTTSMALVVAKQNEVLSKIDVVSAVLLERGVIK